MTMHRPRLILGILALGLLLAGCADKGKPVKVSGTVYGPDGNPLPVAAMIIFQPLQNGRPASGTICDDGSFILTTYDSGDGALPGKYKVVVRLAAMVEDDPQIAHERLVDMDKREKLEPPAPPPLIHPNYTDPVRTPLTQEVPPSGEVKIHLHEDGT
jgi:hypothetical protein